jgi:FkbM family methyltransferase
MNDYADYVYEHIYGDKDTFHLCWRKLGAEVCVPAARAGWKEIAFLQKDFDGKTLFVHRTRCKFRWEGEVDGAGVPNGYMTSQWGSPTRRVKGLPNEDAGHDYCEESSELIRPERHFAFRPDTWDREIWQQITLKNEYGLPRHFDRADVIVDIGAHIGSFAHACLRRGAGRVVCCEPDPGNLDLLRKNLARWGDRVHVVPAAVWPEASASLTQGSVPANTGGLTVCSGPGGTKVPTIGLAEVLDLAGPKVRLLKVDCEGAEHSLLRRGRPVPRATARRRGPSSSSSAGEGRQEAGGEAIPEVARAAGSRRQSAPDLLRTEGVMSKTLTIPWSDDLALGGRCDRVGPDPGDHGPGDNGRVPQFGRAAGQCQRPPPRGVARARPRGRHGALPLDRQPIHEPGGRL